MSAIDEVRYLLKSDCSYDWAVRYLHEGRISQKAFDHFCLFSDWCAERFSGTAGLKQERFWRTHGRAAYYRRIDRVRRVYNRLVGREALHMLLG